jgi:hypothetical protein
MILQEKMMMTMIRKKKKKMMMTMMMTKCLLKGSDDPVPFGERTPSMPLRNTW